MHVENFAEILKKYDVARGSGVPCSYFKPVVNHVGMDDGMDYIPASSEGEAVAIAAGMVATGRPAFALMQNSGLGNAVNPITSLLQIYQIPVMLLVSLRGEPGRPDEPQHELMGQITENLCRLCALPTHVFDPETFSQTLEDAQVRKVPAAWIFRDGSLDGGRAVKPIPIRLMDRPASQQAFSAQEAQVSREEALRLILPWLDDALPLPAVVSTTGKLSRELYELNDRNHSRSNRFYMVGSLGCAAGFGLGIARTAKPIGVEKRRVIVLDGDGALLMKMGTMATIGMTSPTNLHHVVFDNGIHDSTGGQATASPFVDFAQIALACGYRLAETVSCPQDIKQAMDRHMSATGPTFLRILVGPGARGELGRPKLSPPDGWRRMCEFLSV